MKIYSLEEGSQLVRAARSSIELFLMSPNFDKDMVKSTLHQFEKSHGLFVTLEHYPTRELRGCIGFPYATAPLQELLVDAAIGAAFEDPKFISISKKELDHMLVEVSILSKPVLLEGGESRRLKGIKIPGDGIMVEYGHYRGVLLPMVAVEKKLTKRGFLEEACRKAGIHANYWSQPNVKLYRFEAQTFREEEPNGRVIEQSDLKA
jgi:uncharacterized protein (TIGR00296 family)